MRQNLGPSGEPGTGEGRPKWHQNEHVWAALAVCVAATVPYLSTIHNYFVADDFGVVQLLSGKPAFYFPRWFVTSWMDEIWGTTNDEIRPFPALTYQLTARWGAASPVANHVVNIAIHAANALLVLTISRTVARVSLPAALFAALVFAALPIHAESVAWITGRVDTIPAFFYVSSFLAYAWWRRSGTGLNRTYGWSVALFFFALFSKQNTITMVATLLLYDVLVERRAVRVSWSSLGPYVPFIALTGGYLVLRYALFGEVAREGQLSAQGLGLFRIMVGKHFQRLFFGGEVARYPAGFIAAFLVVGGVWLLARSAGARSLGRPWALALGLYFGPVWWALGLAPIAVAGYESTRHVYLASFGWAIILALGWHILWHARAAIWRYAAVVAGVGLLLAYALKLQIAVAEWNGTASVSQQAVADLEREALAAPEGTLLIVAAPVASWAWALPFAAQPPYASTDLAKRVFVVSPWQLHCCPAQWHDYTRNVLRAWSERSDRLPVVALHWTATTGRLSRLSDREYPDLRALIPILLETDTLEALDRGILRITNQLAATPERR